MRAMLGCDPSGIKSFAFTHYRKRVATNDRSHVRIQEALLHESSLHCEWSQRFLLLPFQSSITR
jgi:hypothetical protein